jgi:CheY-like chemotaxis protein
MADISLQSNRVPTVLIADDDPGIARLLAGRCSKMGFEVQTAVNGLQAVIMVGRNRPDVLIVDINMPEVDGLSVCLRVLRSDKTPMNVVVITASSYSDTIARCESFGACFVRKGPALWDGIRSALIGFFPEMANAIVETDTSPPRFDSRVRPRVLVVDGDPAVGTFLSSRLRKCGVDVMLAHDALQGYRMACKDEPSVIISDYLLPHGDAQYLLWRLRSTAETASIPVFVMSADRLDESIESTLKREICGKPGVARFFKKSFDTQELFAALQKYCGFQHLPMDD